MQKTSTQQQLTTMVSKFNDFSSRLNQKFVTNQLPLHIKNFANTFTIDYLNASLYNSRYPQYIMAEGVFLGNYSTGKFNLNNDATQEDLQTLADKFVAAALRMQTDGYFVPMAKGTKKKMMVRLAGRFLFNILRVYYDGMMEDKRIDIEVSHNHPVNKCGHFWSSVFMILMAYPYIFKGMPIHAGLWFFGTHVVRQSGHFFYEKQDRNIEKRKFGHKDASKKAAAAGLFLAGLAYYYRATLMTFVAQYNIGLDLSVEQYVSGITLLTIIPHFVEIFYQFGMLRALEWMIKIITDPFTDVIDFYSYWIIHPRCFLDLKDQKAIYQLDPTTKKVCKVE
jgi:glutamate-1-semialdehyde 2,1-aminomutase